ncbi:MAG: flagellar biosynthesis protein FlhF [Deltaproteobacteria bacterium GWA2_54_12]|nr:MAG: flagellar biosynthesis protein FlhF [Deltaproteobacteria bacterium GWA2_54_12]
MRIKSFTGPSVREALKLVKAEFGEHSLILSNKRLATGLYEVVGAVDYDLTGSVAVDLKAASNRSGSAGQGGKTSSVNETPKGASSRDSGRDSGQAFSQATGTSMAAELKKELKELSELKDLCVSFVTRSGSPVSDVFNKLEENLVKNGVDKRLARKILMNTLSGATKEKTADIMYLKACMRKKVYERIKVKDPLAARGVVAFVGPEGVGKTTTIAKLAAHHALKGKKRMALLTMDTYRIAAAEQLKVYGKLIGVPVEVARDIRELKSFMSSHRDKDLLLIDTAGRGQKDASRMNELKLLADECPEMKFNLVLNSQTRDESMYESVKGFGALPIDSLSFTRLDEGSAHGSILNAMVLAQKPIAYLSTGSRVPEDIETASRERLLSFFMPN